MNGTNDFLQMLAERSKKVIPQNEGDYIKDGILYCGKCNTPKQGKYDVGNGKFLMPMVLCKCETEKRDREQAEFKLRLKKEENERVFKSYINDGLQDIKALSDSFDKDNKPTYEKSIYFRNYCKNWEKAKEMNGGLIILGDVGTGKTFYANCIANEIRRRYGELCLTITTKMLTGISSFDKLDIIKSIVAVDLLVIDDLGAERNSEYAQEIMCDLMDERNKTNKPTIITTNLTMQELDEGKTTQQKRIYDRVREMCSPVQMLGQSERSKIAQQKKQELKDILFN